MHRTAPAPAPAPAVSGRPTAGHSPDAHARGPINATVSCECIQCRRWYTALDILISDKALYRREREREKFFGYPISAWIREDRGDDNRSGEFRGSGLSGGGMPQKHASKRSSPRWMLVLLLLLQEKRLRPVYSILRSVLFCFSCLRCSLRDIAITIIIVTIVTHFCWFRAMCIAMLRCAWVAVLLWAISSADGLVPDQDGESSSSLKFYL